MPLLTKTTNMLKALQNAIQKCIYGTEKVTLKRSFYELVDKNMKGEDVPMSSFKGEVLLVVNVASK